MKTIKTFTFLIVLILFHNGISAQKLRNKIVKSITQIEQSFPSIEQDRKVLLDQLASRLFRVNKDNENTDVVLIDKNNKEKSQLTAIWLKTGLLYYKLKGYNVLSAGTEIVLEPFPTLATLEEYGFKVSNASGNELFSYNVKSGSENWLVKYNTVESLGLKDDSVKIFVEQGIAPEDDGTKQIELPLFTADTIAIEMLYVASMIHYLSEN